MHRRKTKSVATLVGMLAFCLPAPVLAQGLPTAPGILGKRSEQPVDFADLPAPRRFVTDHRVIIKGKPIEYRATAGETCITNVHGEPVARIFSFDYVKQGPREPTRPVLFVFNGGPGSASIWLHMGILGPKRVELTPEVNPANTPPFGLVDNPHSLLDIADIVFIDPVGTGFSQAVGNATTADFAGVDVDAESISRFVELWLTRNGRWNARKYLVGESYGTVRAAVMSRALMGGPLYTGVMRGITLDGVILVGSALDVNRGSSTDAKGPDRKAGRALASMAATAWYHQRIDREGRTVGQVYEAARLFGESDYAGALWRQQQGTLGEPERQAIAARLASFTGLSAQAWIDANLSISLPEFMKRVIADTGLETGMYDSRYTLPLAGSGGDPVSDDPAMGRYVPGFVAAFHMMLHDHLKVDMPIPYISIGWGDLNGRWDYTRVPGVAPTTNFASDLAIAMRRNPALRLMVASGYYDMVTTPAAAAAQVREGGVPEERTLIRDYESGHMLYLGGTAPQFAEDLRGFLLYP